MSNLLVNPVSEEYLMLCLIKCIDVHCRKKEKKKREKEETEAKEKVCITKYISEYFTKYYL